VRGWILPGGEILLLGPGPRVSARILPSAMRAEVRFDGVRAGTDEHRIEVFAVLTLASALLLGRLGRTLVHAGAVLAPDGRAWLLAGSTFSGKSTTCLTLIRAGLDYLADDHVVLGRDGAGELRVEGWTRRFNLDLGYARRVPRGVRERVDPANFGPGRWRPGAALGGLLFPRVQASFPTSLAPLHPARMLSALLQQSPWLLADRGQTPALLGLMKEAAGLPGFELCLGLDTYGHPERLGAVVGRVLAALDRPPGGT
jgi:hypothetical protein